MAPFEIVLSQQVIHHLQLFLLDLQVLNILLILLLRQVQDVGIDIVVGIFSTFTQLVFLGRQLGACFSNVNLMGFSRGCLRHLELSRFLITNI